jgi:LmbE family N-acetylglucosaminyl deacetylase
VGALTSRCISGVGTPEGEWIGWPGLTQAPEIDLDALVPNGRRAVVVAPHPDDEVLGTGGLLARLSASSREILIVAATDGEASHPGSLRWPPHALAVQRALERRTALRHLGIERAAVIQAHLRDGALASDEEALTTFLSLHCGKNDVLFVTWRFDGHPDHEAAARAVLRHAAATGAKVVEVPVWGWHWAVPADPRVPWSRARRVPLDPLLLARKRGAVACFVSQTEPDGSTGRDAILPAWALARLLRPYEVVFL